MFALGGSDGYRSLAAVESLGWGAGGGAGAWRTEMSLPTARQGLAAVALGGRLLALGGQRVAGAEVEELAAVEAFQPLALARRPAP